MQTSSTITVYGNDDRIGTIDSTIQPLDGSQTHILVHLDNSQPLWAPFDLLRLRPDGSYYLPVDAAQLQFQRQAQDEGQAASILVLPVVQEELDVSTRRMIEGVRIHKRVHQREELVDEPGFVEELEVERLPSGRVLDGPMSPYYEGDTFVIPLVEEVVVVEKRLVLKEELRITRHRREVRDPKRVVLRREEASVEQLEPREEKVEK
jgi:uncharacterized protein (TIGR02271 family)